MNLPVKVVCKAAEIKEISSELIRYRFLKTDLLKILMRLLMQDFTGTSKIL